MDELLTNLTKDATANRQETIAFAAGEVLPANPGAELRRNQALGSLGAVALVAGGYLAYRWMKKRRRRR